MKQCFACASVLLLAIGCSNSDPKSNPGPPGSSGGSAGSPAAQGGGGSSNVAGGGASGGSAPVAGSNNGGSGGSVISVGGAGSGGSVSSAGSAGTPGGAGSAGSAGATGNGAYKCPSGTFAAFTAGGAATKVAGTPPADAFNKDAWTNVEGPVWIGDSLYFSEMTNSNMMPPSRILKIAPGGAVSVFAADAGSNGLAVDGSGNLIAAVHKDGSISQISLTGGAATPLVSMYMGKRFTSPNDLAIRSDGTIYFSDPSYQNSANPQMGERLYRVTPGPTRTVSVVTGTPNPPNGVTLSPDEKTLYVTASNNGFKKFAVMADGSLDGGADFVTGAGGDGMAVNCAGEVFVTGGNNTVRVYSAAGAALGTITATGAGTTTNVAFGGSDHKTLYITAQGTEGQRGVYSIALPVPGFPY